MSVPVITLSTERLKNFSFLSLCGKTQLDSKTTLGPSTQLVTTTMCLPDVEDMTHLSVCLHYIQNQPHGKTTLLLHINVFLHINNIMSSKDLIHQLLLHLLVVKRQVLA